jgi:hypothetical protein
MYEKLIKTVDKTIGLIKKSTHLDVEDLHKPLAGKERSLFPLFMAAAWQSGFLVSPEVKVKREIKGTSGSVDAIFFDTEYEQDFVVEAKISTRGSEKGDVTHILKKLAQAKEQLKDVSRTRNGLSRKYALVSCLIVKIGHAGKSKEEALEKHHSFTKQRLKNIAQEFEGKDRYYCKSLPFKDIYRTHNKNSLNKLKDDSKTWCGAVCIILEVLREPS